MHTKEKEYKGRSFTLALLIIVAACALVQVDASYEDMMMKEGKLCLQVRRVDGSHLMVGLWGGEWIVDTDKVLQNIEHFQTKTQEALQGFAERTQEFLARNGINSVEEKEDEEEPIEEIPVDFPTQIL